MEWRLQKFAFTDPNGTKSYVTIEMMVLALKKGEKCQRTP
jgi:hypothetical protein